MFTDRKEAGQALADQLKKYQNEEGVVLAIPRGGVPIGHEIAEALDWPLDLVLSKKIGHPTNKEFAIGAVSLNGYVVNQDLQVPKDYLETEIARVRETLRNNYHKYLHEQDPLIITNKTVIITDDGVATGHTLLSVIDLIRKDKPRKLIVAVPVSAKEAIHKIKQQADEVICLSVPDEFRAVGQFYQDFNQVEDQEVAALLHDRRHFEAR
ncbi:phosphoribosyltransferase [Cesiribacter sp. SM1]|uniref:phosphoribosyltransferase n=1 Tax=Cesiribacter sp. SM1 TaxID=2861196 RepID=UPI001CD44D9B|nr:phosphoribosyltransferase family protein [Cesiribacter sp. SM1]